jgi:hypothetical protein
VNTDHIWNFTTTILTARTRPTRFAPSSQGCEQLGAQLTVRHRAEPRVNGFVAGTHRGVIWEHAWKYARNLFRRISLPKQLLNSRQQKTVFSQANRSAASEAIQSSTLVSMPHGILLPKQGDRHEQAEILGYTIRYEQARSRLN